MRTHCLYNALFRPGGVSALVLLNGPPLSSRLLSLAWPRDRPVVVADGAANLLYAAAPALLPTHIVGDLDSARGDVLARFESAGVEVVSRTSQYASDFTKAMTVAMDTRASADAPVLVLGGYPGAGRLDQFFGNVQELVVRAEQGVDVWWVDERSASMVLGAGRHRIAVDAAREGPMCGLAPIAGPVTRLTTRGLRWDFTDQETRFGARGVVSSSNEVLDACVFVETSGPVLWTCDVTLPEMLTEDAVE